MASYHRILQVFGRSIEHNSLQCDCDIHPWEILINGRRWPGKIRLIGFIDVFFLISYSSNSRFENGIVIYKDEESICRILEAAGKEPSDIGLEPAFKNKRDQESDDDSVTASVDSAGKLRDDKKKTPKYYSFEREPMDYIITGVGHDIGLQMKYPEESLIKYKIKIRKHHDPILKKHVKRAIKQHDNLDLILDFLSLGIIAPAELIGHSVGNVALGGVVEKAARKFGRSMMRSQRNKTVDLTGDNASLK